MNRDVLPRKDDKGKLDYTLLDDMPNAVRAVVEVMQWAITEKSNPYKRGSFRGINPERYLAAMLRHYYSTGKDRKGLDHESKLLHLAHVATNALMALQNLIDNVEGGEMREEFERLERALKGDLEELYDRPVSEWYNDASKEMLEMELNNIGSSLKTIERITALMSDYYKDSSNELVDRESVNAV